MVHFEGIAHKTALFLEKAQLCDAATWAKFVDVFRTRPDSANRAWRGEYWGKMMRGGVFVYKYTKSEELYRVLTASVRDMLTVAEEDGRVSGYTRETELAGWDMWCRKYVLLACEYYLEICRDEALREEILTFLCRATDAILAVVGPDKKPITATSHCWLGANSSSILEPIVRLYRLTGEGRYLDFATYIVEEGGAKGVNLFEAAYENRLLPYQYGVSKAYEVTSCFEGLLEYYYVTGIEKYKTAVINFARALLASEISIIGSAGVTHELFDHTRNRQTVRYDGVVQETCVTVTLMKFFASLLTLTGDSTFADAIEQAFYNAYLGAVNTEYRECPYPLERFADDGVVSTYLPFDSYSPLTPDKRGKLVGGVQLLPDKTYYGCCACIGAAGVGVFLDNAVRVNEEGITVNFYERGRIETEYGGVPVTLIMDTDYPVSGEVRLTVKAAEPVAFTLFLRNPAWAEGPSGYLGRTAVWKEDEIRLSFPMPIRLHTPVHWEEDEVYIDTSKSPAGTYNAYPKTVLHKEEEDHYVAVTRGPLTLAADGRTGKAADSVFTPTYTAEPVASEITDGVPCLLRLHFTPTEGEDYDLVDYASAGHDWETMIAAWLPTR